jgi:SAM-dependent methyltransferase
LLRAHGCRHVLDLGCGTGHDAVALSRSGFAVEAMDHARVAIDQARQLAAAAGVSVAFREGDIGRSLPYADAAFDAVVSNLVLHSFPDTVLRSIVAEVARCVRPGGLFLFHANSTEDAARRLAVQPPQRQLGPWSYVLEGGQTMHFFSRAYCEDLLAGWAVLELEPASSCDADGRPIKSVWRCAARKRP